MLVLRLEAWPGGRKAHRRVIGEAIIANDGTGTVEMGNYVAQFQGDGPTIGGAVRGFPRKTASGWDLVRLALNSAAIVRPKPAPAEVE